MQQGQGQGGHPWEAGHLPCPGDWEGVEELLGLRVTRKSPDVCQAQRVHSWPGAGMPASPSETPPMQACPSRGRRSSPTCRQC